MNTTYFKDFLTIAECGSYEKAAEELYTTQSTLTKHIQKLEAELGTILFDRTSRSVRLNECGRLLLPYAQQTLQIEREYQMALSSYTRETQYTISIGSVTNIVAYRISDIFVKFQRKYPNYHLDVDGGSPYTVYQNLINGQYDFAFLRYTDKTDIRNIVTVPFTTDRLAITCSKSHPLASRTTVQMKELEKENILMFKEHTFMYDFINDACTASGFKPNISFSVHRTENLVELASHNMGICFLMKKPALTFDNPNISVIDLEPAYMCNVDLCYLKGKKLSTAAQNFITFTKQFKKSISD